MRSTPLTDRDRHLLTVAGDQYRQQGTRESDIRALFGMTPTHFYQRVNELLDNEAALAWKPMLVQRLRAQRRSRSPQRVSRRLGVEI